MNSAETIVAVNFGGPGVICVGVVDRIEDGAECIRLLKEDCTWCEAQQFTGGTVAVNKLEELQHSSGDALRFRKGDIGFIVRDGEGSRTIRDADGNEVERLLTLQVHTAESDVGEAQKDRLGQALFLTRTYAGTEGLTVTVDAFKLLTVPDVIALAQARMPTQN